MAFADTAKLVVDLSLTGNFKKELGASQSALRSFGTSVTGNLGKISTATEKARGALSRAGGQIKNLITGPVGMIGLTGVALGVVGALSQAVTKANAFGDAIQRVAAVTGDSVEKTSALVDTLDYFGVSVEDQVKVIGMAEKNLGELADNAKSAAAFQKKYGISLVDTHGKQLDFNSLLLRASDYFNNKHIPAATKAAALAKIFGRNWQQLIPILSQGSGKLKEMEGDAIKLTAADIENMKQFKEASREWDDAIGDLQVTLGAKLLPELTGLAKTASAFVRDHSADIIKFFKDAWQAASHLAGVVGDVGRGLLGVWNAIPEPMRDLLVKGIAADRTIKFLFGFSPVGSIGDALVKGLGSIIGKNIVQPVFVTNQIPGLPGGGGGLPAVPGAGAVGTATGLGLGGLAVALTPATIAGVGLAVDQAVDPNDSLKAIATAETAMGHGIADWNNAGIARLKEIATNTGDPKAIAWLRAHGIDISSGSIESLRGAIAAGLQPGPGSGGREAGSQGDVESRRGAIGDALFKDIAKSKDIEGVRGAIMTGLQDTTGGLEAVRGQISNGLQPAMMAASADQVAAAYAIGGGLGNQIATSGGNQVAATYAAAGGVSQAIRDKDLSIDQSIKINVNVSAAGVTKSVTIQNRYGPGNGSSGKDLGGPNGAGGMVHD